MNSYKADDALRLSRFFGTDPQFWMNLQSAYDLLTAERLIGKKIEREVMPMAS
ncbi:MAG: addiction module HigA family antidote [Lentimonas sp.]|jgi:addiction module HigA family antidote